jgi:ethanolamine transporter EutH
VPAPTPAIPAIFLERRANAMRCNLQDSVAMAPRVGAQAGVVVGQNIGSHVPFKVPVGLI